MEQVFTFMIFRKVFDDDGTFIKEIPAIPHPYNSCSFSDKYIFAVKDNTVDVFLKNIPDKVLNSESPYVPILPMMTFNDVHVFKGNYFIVRIDDKWGAYDSEGKEVIAVKKSSEYQVQELLKYLG